MDFPAKILLFGEYGILLNSMALSVPFLRFSGRFGLSDHRFKYLSDNEKKSSNELKRLLRYFKDSIDQFSFLDLEQFENDVNLGLYFDSSIPYRSGLGSSGALTAGIYSKYAINLQTMDYAKIRKQLASVEAYFHGSSSGIDPLTSYINQPLLIGNSNQAISTPDLSLFFENYTLFLINTDKKGNTGELVSHFLEKYKNQSFKDKIDVEYLPLIAQTIEAIIAGDFESFESLMKKYSMFQLSNLDEMIPVTIRKHFEYGIKTGDFQLKLCGSGGGGYLLALSRNFTKAEDYFIMNQLDYSFINQTEIGHKK